MATNTSNVALPGFDGDTQLAKLAIVAERLNQSLGINFAVPSSFLSSNIAAEQNRLSHEQGTGRN
jgi:hypothetical protein